MSTEPGTRLCRHQHQLLSRTQASLSVGKILYDIFFGGQFCLNLAASVVQATLIFVSQLLIASPQQQHHTKAGNVLFSPGCVCVASFHSSPVQICNQTLGSSNKHQCDAHILSSVGVCLMQVYHSQRSASGTSSGNFFPHLACLNFMLEAEDDTYQSCSSR